MKELMKAISEAKQKIGKANKGSDNPFFKSKYASLESVYEAIGTAIEDAGLVVVQQPDSINDVPVLRTTVFHIDSGDKVESNMPLILDKQNSQGLGSAITYARRYSICAIFGILQEDDDGNKASNPKPKGAITPDRVKKLRAMMSEYPTVIYKEAMEFAGIKNVADATNDQAVKMHDYLINNKE